MSYGDDDLNSVLLGHDNNSIGYLDDELLPWERAADGETSDVYGAEHDSGQPNGPDGFVRYSGHGDESSSGHEPDADRYVPGEGGTKGSVQGAAEQRERERTDAGNRHLRRVATEHGGHSGTGTDGRGSPEGVASSIADAQQRLRGGSSQFTYLRSPDAKPLERQVRLSAPPAFRSTEFEATLMSLRSNAAGMWVLQLAVHSSTVVELKDAHGLALKVTVERKRYDNNGDT